MLLKSVAFLLKITSLNLMSNQLKEQIIDNVAEHYCARLEEHCANNNIDYSDAIYTEWIIDGKDPQDGTYEWLFMDYLVDA